MRAQIAQTYLRIAKIQILPFQQLSTAVFHLGSPKKLTPSIFASEIDFIEDRRPLVVLVLVRALLRVLDAADAAGEEKVIQSATLRPRVALYTVDVENVVRHDKKVINFVRDSQLESLLNF